MTLKRLIYFCIVLPQLLCSFFLSGTAVAQNFEEIVVGVRADAAPFSFRKSREESENLDDYGGYVVEVCREVLLDLIKSKPFEGADIVAKEVTAANRFTPLQAGGGIDLLCGPTSINSERLQQFNASMPVYLTGVTYVEQSLGNYPKSFYCSSIVGFVENTTAENPGLKKLAEANAFLRFSDAIQHLVGQLSLDAEGMYSASELASLIDVDTSNSAFQSVCNTAFTAPPIVRFSDHRSGLDAFCRGEILYYIADVDIIADYLNRREDCSATLSRKVIFIEHYGIFFKSPSFDGNFVDDLEITKSLSLYTKFNMALLRLNRLGEGAFSRAYDKAFQKRPKTAALSRFFESVSFGIR